ncbi:hypothetical protein AB6F55_18315 [Providencia hangzhouensis]
MDFRTLNFPMGTVAIILSTLAMLLNLFYNMLFDLYWPLSKGLRPTLNYVLPMLLVSN